MKVSPCFFRYFYTSFTSYSLIQGRIVVNPVQIQGEYKHGAGALTHLCPSSPEMYPSVYLFPLLTVLLFLLQRDSSLVCLKEP